MGAGTVWTDGQPCGPWPASLPAGEIEKQGSGKAIQTMNRFALRATTVVMVLAVALLVLATPSAAQARKADRADKAVKGKPDLSLKTNNSAGEKVDGPAPVIFFPEPIHDFGTIARGSRVSHNFMVKNNGDAPLRLIKAKGS
jgi:hypothetical protein